MTDQQTLLIEYAKNVLKPKPLLTGTQWANKYFNLSAESSSAPGKFKAYPYQEEILNTMTDLKAKIVVVKKPTRVGYTKLLNATQAYYIDQHPSVILHYQPTDDEARGYAEDEFEPMIRDNPIIAKLIETPSIRGRIKKEKTVKKLYPGGYVEILGAESDRNLNRRTARVAVGDEIDTWKKEAGKAGDTITTMMRRTSDFVYRKNIIGGKPIGGEYDEEKELDDSISVVDYWYKKGDQRKRYLPCPDCNHYQLFEFEDLTWEKDKNKNGDTIRHYPETAHFACNKCDFKIYDHNKREMDKKGKWIAAKPFDGIASFDFWAMLSYSPNVTWTDIVKEFIDATKSRLKMKAFTNEVLARTWEEDFEKIIIDTDGRLEEYSAQVPEGVLVITCGTDIQKERIECEVVGWGAYEESWSIEYMIFHGDTSKPDVWKAYDEFLLKSYECEDGSKMRVHAVGNDTGYRPTVVQTFTKKRIGRRVFAIKGHSTVRANLIPRTATVSKKVKGALLYLVGVNEGKNIISSHIATTEVGAGYMHFPNDAMYSDEYFKQLTSEKKIKTGQWIKTRSRNEALDVRVYAYIALFIANVDLEMLMLREQKLSVVSEIKKQKSKRKSGWMTKD